jgi:hypothetical protein
MLRFGGLSECCEESVCLGWSCICVRDFVYTHGLFGWNMYIWENLTLVFDGTGVKNAFSDASSSSSSLSSATKTCFCVAE